MDLDGWAYDDGCVICPSCNVFISCSDRITEMLLVIPQHECAESALTDAED